MRDIDLTNEVARLRVDRIQELLRRQHSTTIEIAQDLNLSKQWAGVYVQYLRAKRMIHLAEYRPLKRRLHGSIWVALWAWGPGHDAPKPERTTHLPKLGKAAGKSKTQPARDWASFWVPTKEAR